MNVQTDVVMVNHIGAIVANLRPALRPVIEKTGMDMVAIEQELSRVDTGAMRSGWTFEMTGDLEGVNYNSVEYTPVHEYGSVTIPAQPMLHPAIDQVRPGFEAAVASVLAQSSG